MRDFKWDGEREKGNLDLELDIKFGIKLKAVRGSVCVAKDGVREGLNPFIT